MGFATVQTDLAPLYERPTLQSACIDEALFGMSVQVIEEKGGWCYLRTDYGIEGYTACQNLNTDADVALAWKKYDKSVVLASYIDVLGAAAFSAQRLASVPRGGLLVALGQPAQGWQKVGLTDGTTGYTRASYIGEAIKNWAELSPADMRWNIVESALAYNGAAYREGGRTPLGIDAVGLAAMAYHLNGVNIARQPFLKPGGALHSANLDAMDEGDLLYFPDSIGIFMGDGKFIHATTEEGIEGVIVSSLRQRDAEYRPEFAEHIVGVASLF